MSMGIDVRRQDLAGLHVGDVAALALVKAHQHRALLEHMAHRQAGAVAVAPGGPFDGAQMVSARTLPRCQVVLQRPLFDGNLRRHVQVLHLAAATGPGVQAEVRAARPHALGRFAVDGRQAGLFPVVLCGGCWR